MEDIIEHLVDVVETFGYLGIFVMTFIESSFIPLPAEITMIPAGYLVHAGKMNFFSVLIASTAGTVCGAYFNYWIAKKYGRQLLLRFGKMFFLTEEKLQKIDRYFVEHGSISVFTGRLLPGIKHYISFPAGLARMELHKFIFYTALGGSIWMAILTATGYFIGENKHLIDQNVMYVKIGVLGALVLLIAIYILVKRYRKKHNTPPAA